MRRHIRLGLAVCAAVGVVSACGLNPPKAVTYDAYQLTCCPAADVFQVWEPGTTVDLHWIVQTASTTAINPTHKVVITSTLVGPYSDAATKMRSPEATNKVQGSLVTFDDRTAPPVGTSTSFWLPPELPSGYYKLELSWDFGDGGSGGASSIVRVGSQ